MPSHSTSNPFDSSKSSNSKEERQNNGISLAQRRSLWAEAAGMKMMPLFNAFRIQERTLRRMGIRRLVQEFQPGVVRPVVRPERPPRKIMPETAPPPTPSYFVKSFQMSGIRDRYPVASRGLPADEGLGVSSFGVVMLQTASAHATIEHEAAVLQAALLDLENRGSFGGVAADIEFIARELNEIAELLESAWERGYYYLGELDTGYEQLLEEWDVKRREVVEILQRQSDLLEGDLARFNPLVQSLNEHLGDPMRAESLVRGVQSEANRLLRRAAEIELDLKRRYQGIQDAAGEIHRRLVSIHWGLEQLHQADWKLKNGEKLIRAAAARWEQGEEPQGVLYLTNVRIVFEKNERLPDKKRPNINEAPSFSQREVLLDHTLDRLSGVRIEKRGAFGHLDYLILEAENRELTSLPFYIDGCDCEEWARMVTQAISAEVDQVSAGRDAAVYRRSDALDLSDADLQAIENAIFKLQAMIDLRAVRDELEALDREVKSSRLRLEEARVKDYSLENDLEADLSALSIGWINVKEAAKRAVEREAGILEENWFRIHQSLEQLKHYANDTQAARALYLQVKSELAEAVERVDLAQAAVLAIYDPFADELESLAARIEWLNWALDAYDLAFFGLIEDEKLITAAEALRHLPKTGPEFGVLFLTTKRILWENRSSDSAETSSKITAFELENVNGFDKLIKEEWMEEGILIQPTGPAHASEAMFEFIQPIADTWMFLLEKVKSDGFVQEEALSVTEADLKNVQSLPATCDHCGANLPNLVLRGQTNLQCEFCGKLTRL